MGATKIEWVAGADGSKGHSINPIRAVRSPASGYRQGGVGHYCEKVSPGCAHCYASALQPRFGMPRFEDARSGIAPRPDIFLDKSKLDEVLRRRKPTRYFWGDMTDLFGDWVNDEWLDRCFATMALTPQHTHLLLTKRPERMRDYVLASHRMGEVEAVAQDTTLPDGYPPASNYQVPGWPLSNVWKGASAEDQQRADERIPLLLQTPAAVRFVSAEPLLGPINLRQIAPVDDYHTDALDTPDPTFKLSWVIVGGESGPKARPSNVAHVRSIVEQCKAAGVPCFVKQDSGRRPGQQGRLPDALWHVKEFPDGLSRHAVE